MHLNMYWLKSSHTNEYTNCISRCVYKKPSNAIKNTKRIWTRTEQTPTMPSRAKCASQIVMIKHIPWQQGHKMYLNLCWPNPSQHVLTKLIQCKRGHKMHLNVYWPISSNTSEGKKCISPCVDQTLPMLARKQNTYQHVLTKSSQCLWRQKGTSTCLYRTHPMQARTQNAVQRVLAKLIQC